eukprot:8725566-Pyramimonas_sp.AAC.1
MPPSTSLLAHHTSAGSGVCHRSRRLLMPVMGGDTTFSVSRAFLIVSANQQRPAAVVRWAYAGSHVGPEGGGLDVDALLAPWAAALLLRDLPDPCRALAALTR